MVVKSANGVTGMIIRTSWTEYVFRVVNDDDSYTDYDILHSDLIVTIDDPDAYFYTNEHRSVLDHSPETYGK
jgi:hypothetical protein